MTSPSQIDVTPEINGWKTPDRIWLMDLGCGDVTWCEDPDPDGEQVDSVEYVRADLAMSRTIPPTEKQEVETYRQMHETAVELGYPSILEALEALSTTHSSEDDAAVDVEHWASEDEVGRLIDNLIQRAREYECAVKLGGEFPSEAKKRLEEAREALSKQGEQQCKENSNG